jgi:hypothetical protein
MWGGLFMTLGAIYYNQPIFIIVGLFFLIVSFFLLRDSQSEAGCQTKRKNSHFNDKQKSYAPKNTALTDSRNSTLSDNKQISNSGAKTDEKDFFEDYPTSATTDFFADYPTKGKQ